MPVLGLSSLYDRNPLLCKEKSEEILKDNPGRWVILPIKYQSLWSLYKAHELEFWAAEDIEYKDDMKIDCAKLLMSTNDNEGHLNTFKNDVRTFIAYEAIRYSEVSVFGDICLLSCKFLEEIQVPESRAFYGFQCAADNIHLEVHGFLVNAYNIDIKQEHKKISAMKNIINKRNAIAELLDASLPFAERLLSFALLKTLFNGARSILLEWSMSNLVLPSLCDAYRHVIDDERLHGHFSLKSYSLLNNRLSLGTVRDIVQKCVEIENQFALELLPLQAMGLNQENVKGYIQYLGNSFVQCVEMYTCGSISGGNSNSGSIFSFMNNTDHIPIPKTTRKIDDPTKSDENVGSNTISSNDGVDVSDNMSFDHDF